MKKIETLKFKRDGDKMILWTGEHPNGSITLASAMVLARTILRAASSADTQKCQIEMVDDER